VLGGVADILRIDLLTGLALSIVFGGAIGVERELKGKPAGLRTNILICAGSVLFTDLSITMAGTFGDPARIAAQVVTGVGFIGAGTIIHGRGSITGLTSAATIWIVAAIGMTLGFGAYLEAAGATLLVFLVLSGLGWAERQVALQGEASTIRVEAEDDPEVFRRVEEVFQKAGLEVDEMVVESAGKLAVITLHVLGPRRNQNEAKLALLRTTGAHRVSVVK
jgi:putative Mg2+ transporter-C (MgtC) family protein